MVLYSVRGKKLPGVRETLLSRIENTVAVNSEGWRPEIYMEDDRIYRMRS